MCGFDGSYASLNFMTKLGYSYRGTRIQPHAVVYQKQQATFAQNMNAVGRKRREKVACECINNRVAISYSFTTAICQLTKAFVRSPSDLVL